MKSTVNQRIKELINALGMTSNGFAESLGTSSARISHVATGRNEPSFDLLNKILEVHTNVSAEWLLRGKGNMFVSDESASVLDKELNEEDRFEVKLALAEIKGYLRGVFRGRGKEDLYYKFEQHLPKSEASERAYRLVYANFFA